MPFSYETQARRWTVFLLLSSGTVVLLLVGGVILGAVAISQGHAAAQAAITASVSSRAATEEGKRHEILLHEIKTMEEVCMQQNAEIARKASARAQIIISKLDRTSKYKPVVVRKPPVPLSPRNTTPGSKTPSKKWKWRWDPNNREYVGPRGERWRDGKWVRP